MAPGLTLFGSTLAALPFLKVVTLTLTLTFFCAAPFSQKSFTVFLDTRRTFSLKKTLMTVFLWRMRSKGVILRTVGGVASTRKPRFGLVPSTWPAASLAMTRHVYPAVASASTGAWAVAVVTTLSTLGPAPLRTSST